MRFITIITALGITSLSHVAAAETSVLREIFSATQQHPGFATFKSQAAAAQTLSAIEAGRRLPKIDGIANYQQQSDSNADGMQAGLRLTYPIYDNGRQDWRDSISDAQQAVELFEAMVGVEEIFGSLGDAYIEMSALGSQRQQHEQSLQSFGELMAKIDELASLDEVSQIQVARVSSKLLDLKSGLLDVELELGNAQARWRESGVNVPNTLPANDLADVGGAVAEPANLLRLQALTQSAEANHKLAVASEGLSVSFEASAIHRLNAGRGVEQNDTLLGLNATYPLFDGGVLEAQSHREGLVAQAARDEYLQSKRRQESDVQQLRVWLDSKQNLIDAKAESCELLDRTASDLRLRFEFGRGDVAEIADAIVDSHECHIGLVKQSASLSRQQLRLAILNGVVPQLLGEL